MVRILNEEPFGSQISRFFYVKEQTEPAHHYLLFLSFSNTTCLKHNNKVVFERFDLIYKLTLSAFWKYLVLSLNWGRRVGQHASYLDGTDHLWDSVDMLRIWQQAEGNFFQLNVYYTSKTDFCITYYSPQFNSNLMWVLLPGVPPWTDRSEELNAW